MTKDPDNSVEPDAARVEPARTACEVEMTAPLTMLLVTERLDPRRENDLTVTELPIAADPALLSAPDPA